MMRKILFLFLFLLIAGFQNKVAAQVRDSVTITMPPYTDTTCDSTQLTFIALESSDTFSDVVYMWYTSDTFLTGVTLDTLLTTALTDSDSVFCKIAYTNSFGNPDTSTSNIIVIRRAASIDPGVAI